jgi:hypothetical protein
MLGCAFRERRILLGEFIRESVLDWQGLAKAVSPLLENRALNAESGDQETKAVGVVKATLADIKAGSFVGIGAMPQADGTQRALEVLIFPDAMRGTGEGHYPWDLQPKSTMTNGNVEQVVTSVDGGTLTVKYKDGEKKIIVPPDVPIVTFVPGDKADLKPGVKIFIVAAKKLPDSTLQAARVNYGKDGLTPPM